MIDISKNYKTRSGFPVKIIKTNKQHVEGFCEIPNYGWCEAKWYIDGDFLPDFEESSLDLIEVKGVEDEKTRIG